MEILPLRAAIDGSVYINASDIIRELPSSLYGSNINFIDNGSGILNPTTLDIYENIAERFAAINLSTIRFPGGSLSERYNWWYGIGPQASRPMGINAYSGGTTDNNYGIDEHYDFCQEIGAKPTITVNFGNGTALTAANWVEYCNSEIPQSGTSGWTVNDFKGNESAPAGYFAWLRGQYGHIEPYGIANWEVGNEVYNDWTNDYNATQYATRFLTYSSAMKAVDPTIKIAAVGYEEPNGIWGTDTLPWNEEVARIAGAEMDALHIHTYGPVSEDGKTYFLWGNSEITQSVVIPEAGDYVVWLTAKGMNDLYGTYPSGPDNFSNLSLNLNGISQVNFSLVIANSRLYNNTIYFPSAGTYNLGIEFNNDAPGRDVMLWSEVTLEKGSTEIKVDFKNQTLMYNAVMATANYRGESVAEIAQILKTETSRDDIEIWVTEFNTLYNTIGYGIDQPLKFQSAIAMADMALQFVKNGANVVQQWSSMDDFFFSLMLDARTLGQSSMLDTLSLLLKGWGSSLLNSTVLSPTFDLDTQVGWIPAIANNPYLDILPTQDGDTLSVILINKHPTDTMNVDVEIEGFNSTQSTLLTTMNSTTIGAMNFNPPNEYYSFTSGKVGQAIKINSTRDISYPSYDNAFAQRGTVEFWICPEWDGDDSLDHPILSIGQTFQLLKTHDNAIVAVMVSDNYTEFSVIYGATSTWNAGEWHHIGLTWDVATNWNLYLDNVKVMTVPLNGFHAIIEHRQPMIIGSSLFDRNSNVNASIDEFRISRVVRSDSEIAASYATGLAGNPLGVDANTSVLFHFDNSIQDSGVDQQTIVTSNNIALHSSGGVISLPRCSISLLQYQRYIAPSNPNPPDDDNDDSNDNDDSSGDNGSSDDDDTGGNNVAGFDFYVIIITSSLALIVMKKKKNIHNKA